LVQTEKTNIVATRPIAQDINTKAFAAESHCTPLDFVAGFKGEEQKGRRREGDKEEGTGGKVPI